MKRYLTLGLLILILTNIMLFVGVWINRTGLATSELVLTERELSLPYLNVSQQEDSGLALQIKWRVPIQGTDPSHRYNYQRYIDITETELVSLGFEPKRSIQRSNVLKKELYWALEFDGELYQKQLSIIEDHYQIFSATFTKDSDKEQHRLKIRLEERLDEEKIQSSLLFLLETAQNSEELIEKYINQKNILIVKGQARPTYDQKTNAFRLHLHTLSNPDIMLTREQMLLLKELKPVDTNVVNKPRYTVDVKWGSRFEPWVTSLKNLAD